MAQINENAKLGVVAAESREHCRDAVAITAILLLSEGPRFKVQVRDLSPAGFRIQTANHISLGRIVYLTIPNFSPLQARVAWNDKEQYGCELTKKMHSAVFTHIASAFPMLTTG